MRICGWAYRKRHERSRGVILGFLSAKYQGLDTEHHETSIHRTTHTIYPMH